jgi:hypothetical protein
MRRFGWKGRGEEEGARYSIKLMLHSFVFGKSSKYRSGNSKEAARRWDNQIGPNLLEIVAS